MVTSDFEGLGGYRTLMNEGQVPITPYNCCFRRLFPASVCIATYCMSVPSLHTESTDSAIISIRFMDIHMCNFQNAVYRAMLDNQVLDFVS